MNPPWGGHVLIGLASPLAGAKWGGLGWGITSEAKKRQQGDGLALHLGHHPSHVSVIKAQDEKPIFLGAQCGCQRMACRFQKWPLTALPLALFHDFRCFIQFCPSRGRVAASCIILPLLRAAPHSMHGRTADAHNNDAKIEENSMVGARYGPYKCKWCAWATSK